MMTLGGNRRLPGLGRAGLAPGLGIPLNGVPTVSGINPLGVRGFVGGGLRGLGGLAGGRLNGTGLAIAALGGLGNLNGLNTLGTLTTVNPLLNPLATGALYGNQLGPALPLNALQKQLTTLPAANLLALQALAATGGVGYNNILGLHQHKKDGDNNCCTSSDNQNRRVLEFKHKDVTIRGKAYAVRASYLTDFGKFEGDLIKFMDKKKEDDVPDRVVDMLISFINWERYSAYSVLDEVTLNIVAANVGAKSAVEHSLKNIKSRNHCEGIDTADQLVKIVYTIMASSRVDDGLVEWLKKLLMKDDNHLLKILTFYCAEYINMAEQLPEIHDHILKLVGLKAQENGDFGRTV